MKPLKFLSLIKNTSIANSARIYPFSRINNSFISDFTYVSYGCVIINTSIGKFCSIAQNVKMGLGNHPIDFISTSPIFYTPNNPLRYQLCLEKKFVEYQEVTIGNDVWIGANVTILDGVTIGNGCIIGANSVVVNDIKPYTIVGGVPAKEIKSRFTPSIISILEDSEWWELPLEFYKEPNVLDIFSRPLEVDAVKKLMVIIDEYRS